MQGTREQHHPWRRPVQARSQARVAALLDAAVEAFTDEGYLAATTTGIAERAGVPIGSLYQYFPDKAAVLYALAEVHLEEAEERLAAALAAAGAATTLDELIDLVVRAAVDANDGDPRLHRILYREAARPPALQERLAALEAGLAAWVAEQLHRLGATSAPDHLRARMLVSALEAVIHEVVLDPPPGTTRAAATDEAVRIAAAIARA